nr:retrovirus-related Pol polyprotein from transposon TNT 1-94 [Tanacetum cinerariifolium]
MSPANKANFEAEKEAIYLILTGIGDEIYSTVDACQTAQEMWEAIKRLQQGESLNIQDIKTKLFWEFARMVKGKEIAKPITPPSETASEEDSDPEQAQRDKDIQKNLALIGKYIKKIYKPTNNNHRTSSNSRNKNVDTTPWYKNDNHSRQFGNQRTVNVAGARENELKAHYSYMAKIQEVSTADSGIDSKPLEQVQNETRYNVFANDLQHSEQSKSISNTCLVETVDTNVIPDSPDIDLQGNDLLTDNRGSDLYTIFLQESTSLTPLCLMAKASPTQAWLWHRRLSHLNFDYINLLSKKDVVIGLPKLKFLKDQLCSSCKLSKAKRSLFKPKAVPSLKGRLNFLHMDLCGLMRVVSINGKKYILVIVDDYSRDTWTLFLRSKDETPEVLKEFLTMIQRNFQALVITIQTDRGTEFLNKTLNAFFKEEGIEHQTSINRTPKHNVVVERQNRTLVEAA